MGFFEKYSSGDIKGNYFPTKSVKKKSKMNIGLTILPSD
jgi:hypothetical protein